jgi:RNA polymerase sigma-70 factor (ECF subfamily)
MKQQADSHHFDLKRIEDQEEIERMLVNLPADDAEVVKQYHLEGRSYREISTHLGIPENTIGPTLTRARQKLRRGTGS